MVASLNAGCCVEENYCPSLHPLHVILMALRLRGEMAVNQWYSCGVARREKGAHLV